MTFSPSTFLLAVAVTPLIGLLACVITWKVVYIPSAELSKYKTFSVVVLVKLKTLGS
jgi:hypothetical protein